MIGFDEFRLSPQVQQAILDMGFQEPSAIQAKAIPLLLEGKDIIGQAHTGTGKTAAFAIPIVERIDIRLKQVQALILCPTRELAVQVAEEFRKLTKHHKQISVATIYGGQPIQRQFQALSRKPQIVVGTPGRLLDHVNRRSIQLSTVTTVVLDEADEMLSMGFREDIEAILEHTPQTRQTVFFSATMPKAILSLTERYQRDPHLARVIEPPGDSSLIEQFYIEVHRRQKLATLIYLIEHHSLHLGLVFCNTKRQVDELVQRLQGEGYLADGLHGGLTQPKRDKVMNRFRTGKVQFLIATDVAARGIDVQNIDVVFNYDLPDDQEYYIHRIGRTGRAGKPGKAITFVEKNQGHQLKRMKQSPNSRLIKQEIPTLAQSLA